LCAQLTRDLCAIADFLVVTGSRCLGVRAEPLKRDAETAEIDCYIREKGDIIVISLFQAIIVGHCETETFKTLATLL